MPKISIKNFCENPVKFRFTDIQKLLLQLECIEQKAKGSYVKFKHKNFGKNNDLIIPIHRNDCKDFYKKKAAKMIYKYLK